MLKIVQPLSQIRLTNVAVVRLRQGGQRFEIACYPNKVRDWRNGFERDVKEVLQSRRVFSNVHKGEFAKDTDLMRCFNTTDISEVSTIILNKGDVQLSVKERQLARDNFIKEVCALCYERVYSYQTGLFLTPAMVESTAKQHNILPKYKEGVSSKAACSTLVSRLIAKLPTELGRAMMRADLLYEVERQSEINHKLVDHFSAQIIEVQPEGDKRRLAFRAPTADFKGLLEYAPTVGAELIVIDMLDKSAPMPAPNPAGKATASPAEEPSSEESDSPSSSSSTEEEETEGEGSNKSEDGVKRRGLGFAALASDSESSEGDEEVEEASDVSKKVDLAGLEAELGALTAGRKAERVKRENLEVVAWERRQAAKRSLQKQKKKDRKAAEVAAVEKQRLKEEAEIKRSEAERRQQALPALIMDGGPDWCVDCQVNYVKELGQDLRQHFRMEWHIFNSKRRIRGKPPVPRHEFDELSRDIKDGFLAVTF
eukprot:Protomagalhaensia_sp_Gyna_25__3806@NODE_341_length_3814_cov_136_672848_g267_i0_p2_GENE_NODE_341_length_3814_cov_136_672848_g267_i0NODE_341_length_3814_cov_136_672848_g267_i0_p2_ORF_typecomplete_len483_score112_49SBDS/PF01172_18/5e29Caldesmon/PF02029_15/0_0072SBDS_C/PF09377_10/0_023CENPH/PF05837_12/1_3e04CENPH/PF05837_12/2_8e03CENPH/PF05837_12/0_61Anillin_N/PF16018_5/0_1Anillin_N/PF16018_5/3_5e03_NODE_341_length_3814_cov_136_672848_g267_i023013749